MFPPTFQNQVFAVARPTVLLSRSSVTVSESQIEYRIDQNFLNDNDFPLEGVFILPFDPRDKLAGPDVKINGEPASYKLISGEDLFAVLKEITNSIQDPCLLALAGKSALVIRPVHMGIKQQKSLRITYTVPIAANKDSLDVLVPLDGERYSLGPVGELEIRVRFKMSRPVRNVFSPSHHLSILREAPNRCMVTVRSEEKKTGEDFRLFSTFSDEDIDLRVLTNRVPGNRGSFMVLVSPPLPSGTAKEPNKDVVFLLDSSASINNEDLNMAKRALIFGLERLKSSDRLNVMTMDTRVRRMADKLVPANADNIIEATKFINAVASSGGTDLYNGMIGALEQFTSKRRTSIIYMAGDGRATIGVTNPETIIEDVRRNNRAGTRIFALGLGEKADISLLDKIAVSNRGASIHLSGRSDFHSTVNRFFSGITPAQVSEITIEFQDISPEELEPDPIPDLFGQESIIILGRYSDKEDAVSQVRLRAKVQGRSRTISKTFGFPKENEHNSYVAGLWAMRRIARLLDQEWFRGTELELREKIGILANEFGFKVPSVHSTGPSSAATKDAGALIWRYKASNVAADVESESFRAVENKTFRLQKGVWIDREFRPVMTARTVRFMSNEYFSMVRNDPQMGNYFSLGPEIILMTKGGPIKVTADKN